MKCRALKRFFGLAIGVMLVSTPAHAMLDLATKTKICEGVANFAPTAIKMRDQGFPETTIQSMTNGQDEPARSLLSSSISLVYQSDRSTSEGDIKKSIVANCVEQLTQMFG